MSRELAIATIANQRLRFKRNDVIGGPLWHTVGDRFDMVKKMSTEIAQVHNEAMRQMGWLDTAPSAQEGDPRWQWYKAVVIPFLNEWEQFRTKLLGSWRERFFTNWDVIEGWQYRMLRMMELVGAKFSIDVPAPAPLTQTMWQNAKNAIKDPLSDLGKILKTLLYVLIFGGLAVGLILAVRR